MIPTSTRSSTSSAARRPITARAFHITHDADEKAICLHTPAFSMDKRAEHDSPPVLASGYDHPEADQDEVCDVEGVRWMEAKIPVRRFSWPAFWLAGRGSTGAMGRWTQWAPKIDLLEKFN